MFITFNLYDAGTNEKKNVPMKLGVGHYAQFEIEDDFVV